MENKDIFNRIYKKNLWLFGSGPGSIAWSVRPYIRFLQQFLDEHPDIRSVLDVGCGDWQMGSQIEWGNRQYTGIDISDHILAITRDRYGTDQFHFHVIDAAQEALPPADLIIIKDVLIHLSNKEVETILEKCRSYPYVIIVNDVGIFYTANRNIQSGWIPRKLDVSLPPFSFPGKKMATFYERIFTVAAALFLSLTSMIVFPFAGFSLWTIFGMLSVLFLTVWTLPKKMIFVKAN